MRSRENTPIVRRLIDIGVNLTHDSFDHDRPEVIERAIRAGVTRMIVTGSTADSSRAALRLAQARPGQLFATAGVHPHHATGFDPQAAAVLVELAADPATVAIGECGLDYFRDFSPRPVQRRVFARQLSLASTVGKPVFLHQREAHADFLAIIREHIGDLAGGVAHCFTGSRGEMDEYLELGLYIGITGWICDERRGEPLRQAVRHLPLDRVMLETDAPYLLPRNLGQKVAGRRNEPAFLGAVLAAAAAAMAVTAETLAQAATANTERLFGLPAT